MPPNVMQDILERNHGAKTRVLSAIPAVQLASGRQQHSVITNDDARMVRDANHVEKGSNQAINLGKLH